MDPQTKGIIIGGLTSLTALAVSYLVTRGGKQEEHKEEKPKTEDSNILKPEFQQIEETAGAATKQSFFVNESQSRHASMADLLSKPSVILLGDVGGTNVRLVLRKVYLHDLEKPSEDIKDSKTDTQPWESFEVAVASFLQEFENKPDLWPQAAVIGVAGPVDNNMVKLTNVPHWPMVVGLSLAQTFDIPDFILINDFAAAGYGVLTLRERDLIRVTDVHPQDGGVKIVIGPGTGLGQGLLCKGQGSKYYDIFPSEGGHVEFSVRSQEDWELAQFAHEFIEHSQNVENLRANGKISRISIERLCAGPALPLIYDFFAKKNPSLERTLEALSGKSFEQVTGEMIVEHGLKKKDPLCLKVIEKFTEIFAVEVGNTALKSLPYGGIYLTGGVTNGIVEYITHSDTFLKNFYAKGRQEEKMRKMPIFIVKHDIQLGLNGAEECARRILSSKL